MLWVFLYPQISAFYALVFLTAACQYIDMVCIYCGQKTTVINSRLQKRTNLTWRRRECLECGSIITTIEQPLWSQTLAVRSSSGTTSNFIPEKLFLSIYESLKHRPAPITDAKHLLQTVISKISQSASNGVIESRVITNTTLVALNRFDKTASTHYRAFHKLDG